MRSHALRGNEYEHEAVFSLSFPRKRESTGPLSVDCRFRGNDRWDKRLGVMRHGLPKSYLRFPDGPGRLPFVEQPIANSPTCDRIP